MSDDDFKDECLSQGEQHELYFDGDDWLEGGKLTLKPGNSTAGWSNNIRFGSSDDDDVQDFMNPELAEERARAHEECTRNAESLSVTVRALADAGEKIGAIKTYREDSGVSLMEAKNTVEAYLSNREREQ